MTVLRVADRDFREIADLLTRYGLDLNLEPDQSDITGSFWGAPEAGIVAGSVYVRADTPVHSVLHEASHIVCMTPDRRAILNRDAGGTDLEETAVCYLQIVLSDFIASVGRDRLMQDMDTWGYSFRLGSTQRWFESDADDAQVWLRQNGLLTEDCLPGWCLRQ